MNLNPVKLLRVNPMKCWREPSLEDILSDPITQAVISADGVDTGELDAMLRRVAAQRGNSAPLARRRGP
jgi:hypothetical protein